MESQINQLTLKLQMSRVKPGKDYPPYSAIMKRAALSHIILRYIL
jgi:hypothetical protein